MTGGLPPIDSSLVPDAIRQKGQKATQLYQAALAFESVLDSQLGQALTATLQDGSDGSSPDAATSLVEQMLPGALAQGLTQGGGLGLAGELYQALAGPSAAAPPAPAPSGPSASSAPSTDGTATRPVPGGATGRPA